MAEKNKSDQTQASHDEIPHNDEVTGSPGVTAGTAEGDRETIEEDLRNKNLADDQNSEQ